MPAKQKVCHRVFLKSDKQRDGYRRREDKHIDSTPHIAMGKFENGVQQIWTEQLQNQTIARLKQLNTSDRALYYAKTIATACCGLSQIYGYFMINENMVFFNDKRQVFAWINPDILENHIKIYLPFTLDGEQAMIRSIISYFKLWLRCDFQLLSEVKRLNELPNKLDQIKLKAESLIAKSPSHQYMATMRHQKLLADNKSTRDAIGRSPGQQLQAKFLNSSLSNKINVPMKFNHVSTEESFKGDDFQHHTFTNHGGVAPNNVNRSVGPKTGGYFPNKTTSNKNHIVSMINKLDSSPNNYAKNKILIEQDEHSNDRQRKMKESLCGIGQQLNDLFLSTIQNEEENEQELKKIEAEFQNLLG